MTKGCTNIWVCSTNRYGQLLMDKELFVEAKKYFIEAYEIYIKIHGKINEEAIMMLNNLAVVCISVSFPLLYEK